jgi:hypothetical protein
MCPRGSRSALSRGFCAHPLHIPSLWHCRRPKVSFVWCLQRYPGNSNFYPRDSDILQLHVTSIVASPPTHGARRTTHSLNWILCIILYAHILDLPCVHSPPSLGVELGIWAELFGPARARLENKSSKHGPARNNMGRASTARRQACAGPQILARRAPDTAHIDEPGLGRHGPIKPNLFNFFNLVR